PTYNYMCAAAATYLLLFLPHLAPTAIYTLSLHDALPIITKDYGDQRGIFNIDLGIRKGEIFGFIGTNGSGKTTTIREIMGFIRPDAGNIQIREYDAHRDATKTKRFIGYVPGEIAFPDLPSGKSFIRFQAELLNLKDLRYADELVKILQIDLRANPRKMSKGMKQKTAIIAAL